MTYSDHKACSLTCLCQVGIKKRVKTGAKGKSEEQLKKYPSALNANTPALHEEH